MQPKSALDRILQNLCKKIWAIGSSGFTLGLTSGFASEKFAHRRQLSLSKAAAFPPSQHPPAGSRQHSWGSSAQLTGPEKVSRNAFEKGLKCSKKNGASSKLWRKKTHPAGLFFFPGFRCLTSQLPPREHLHMHFCLFFDILGTRWSLCCGIACRSSHPSQAIKTLVEMGMAPEQASPPEGLISVPRHSGSLCGSLCQEGTLSRMGGFREIFCSGFSPDF